MAGRDRMTARIRIASKNPEWWQGQNDSQNPNSQQNPNSGQGQNSQQSQNGSQGCHKNADEGVSGGSLLSRASASAVSDSEPGVVNGNAEETADSSGGHGIYDFKNENVLLSVNIDELDILPFRSGHSALLRWMRWKEQEFEGKSPKSAEQPVGNSGGVTKYTAEVTIPKEESMLAGDEVTGSDYY